MSLPALNVGPSPATISDFVRVAELADSNGMEEHDPRQPEARQRYIPPRLFPVVSDDDWLDDREAAALVGVPRLWLLGLWKHRHLERAENSRGEPGYQKATAEAERAWRDQASVWAILRRAFIDVLRNPGPGRARERKRLPTSD